MPIQDPHAFISGRKKAEVITDLIANHKHDLGKAEKFWDKHGKGQSAVGFIAKFNSALLEAPMDAKQVKKFVTEHGTKNTLTHLSSYVARAKFATELRNKLTGK